MSRKINKNFLHLRESHKNNFRGAVLEGSSRSGKTWSSIDFLVYLCYRKHEKGGQVINIIRETYNSFKTTLYDDFNKRLPMLNVLSPFQYVKEVPTFKLNKNTIHLIGADKPSKYLGAGCDYFFINEAMEIERKIFDQAEMRCRNFWWMDYNPSYEDHYIYNSITSRDDVAFLRTTFLDNPFISVNERNKILSYNPDNQKNIDQGTADDYMWKVYGLGLRASPKGLIFPYWKEYEKLPGDRDYYKIFVVDFGGNDPHTISEINISKKYSELYIFEHMYQSEIETKDFIDTIKRVNPDNNEVVCDNARRDKIFDFQMAGIMAFGFDKGQIVDGIDIMRQYKIFIHTSSANAKKEFNSYKWVEDARTGTITNKPEDKNNHIIDPVRYGVRYYHKNFAE